MHPAGGVTSTHCMRYTHLPILSISDRFSTTRTFRKRINNAVVEILAL